MVKVRALNSPLLWFICLTLLIFMNCGAQSKIGGIDRSQAIQFFNEGNYISAIQACDSLLSSEPGNAEIWKLKGRSLDRMGNSIEGISALSRSIELKSDSNDAFVYRSLIYKSLGDVESAILDMEKAIIAYPDNVEWLTILAGLQFAARDFKKMRITCDAILKIDNLNYFGYWYRGYANKQLGQKENAMSDYSRAIEIDKNNPLAYQDRGYLKLETEDLDGAKKDYDLALFYHKEQKELDSLQYAVCLNNRGFVCYKRLELTEGLENITASIVIYPSNSYAYKNRALIYIALDKKDEGCRDLEMATMLGFKEKYGNEVEDLFNKNCR